MGLRWRTIKERNRLRGKDLVNYHLKELRYCAQCLIEDEDFDKRLRCTYIFGFGYKFKVTWLVQDIRHKFGLFYFFIKFVIFSFLHMLSLHRAYRIEDSRDGKHIGFRGSLSIKCLTIYMHHSRERLYCIRSLFVDNKKGKRFRSGIAWIKGKTRFVSFREMITSQLF
jgi:hypothetical protein